MVVVNGRTSEAVDRVVKLLGALTRVPKWPVSRRTLAMHAAATLWSRSIPAAIFL